MTITVVTKDIEALPAELLPLVKQHCRVDHAEDDALLTSIIARAIGHFESKKGVTVNPTAVVWTPVLANFKNGMATLPVRPALLATPLEGYAVVLKWDEIHGVPIQALQGTAADGLSVELLAGYASAAAIPPHVEDTVMRHSAHLYEHREILVPGGKEYVAPDVADDATWWMPIT